MRNQHLHANDQITSAENDLAERVNARVAELVMEWTMEQGDTPSAAQESKFMDQAWRELA